MLFALSPIESYEFSGSTCASTYRGVAIPTYAEVASAGPRSSVTAQLCAKLDNVMLDCQQAGWDGYGAEPVTPATHAAAKRFIRSLPPGFPTPELAPDPDGCINFEWHRSPRKTLAVSVHPDYRVDFAALLGAATIHGSEPFFSEKLPLSVVDLVRRLYAI